MDLFICLFLSFLIFELSQELNSLIFGTILNANFECNFDFFNSVKRMESSTKKRKIDEESFQIEMDVKSEMGNADDSMFQKFIDVIMTKMTDVSFVFEEDDETIKIPAHKDVLAASSPIFQQMFNGPYKKRVNVKIDDVSPAAFKEFLLFFYGQQITLTMDNVFEVMRLIDRYHVSDFHPACIDFLMETLTTDDVIWALHLSFEYQLNDLTTICTNEIQTNFKKVWSMFEIMDSGKLELAQNGRNLTQEDTERIFQHVFEISKKVIPDQSEMIQYSLNGIMRLTDIFFSKLYPKVY